MQVDQVGSGSAGSIAISSIVVERWSSWHGSLLMCFVRLRELDGSVTIKNMVNIEA